MKPSLRLQTRAVDSVHTYARRRGSPAMKPKEWEMLALRLGAAFVTLTLLQASYDRLKADAPWFVADLESGE